jgi:hypothetical protein
MPIVPTKATGDSLTATEWNTLTIGNDNVQNSAISGTNFATGGISTVHISASSISGTVIATGGLANYQFSASSISGTVFATGGLSAGAIPAGLLSGTMYGTGGIPTLAHATASISGTLLATGGTPVMSLAIASQTQGDVILFNGTNWTRLGAGTIANVLNTSGTTGNPYWAAAAGASWDTADFTPLFNAWGTTRPAGWRELTSTSTVTYGTTIVTLAPTTTANAYANIGWYMNLAQNGYRIVMRFSAARVARTAYRIGIAQLENTNSVNAQIQHMIVFIGRDIATAKMGGQCVNAGVLTDTAEFSASSETTNTNWDILWNRASVEFLQNAVSRGTLTTNVPDDRTMSLCAMVANEATAPASSVNNIITSFEAL